MRLVLDAMGGDHAPESIVEGGALFAREHPDVELILVGDEARIGPILSKLEQDKSERRKAKLTNLSVRHASEVVEMDDHAAQSIRKKVGSPGTELEFAL